MTELDKCIGYDKCFQVFEMEVKKLKGEKEQQNKPGIKQHCKGKRTKPRLGNT